MQSKAKRSEAKQRIAKQSDAKQSKAKQSYAKHSDAKQNQAQHSLALVILATNQTKRLIFLRKALRFFNFIA